MTVYCDNMPVGEEQKRETAKELLGDMEGILREMETQVAMISDAVYKGEKPVEKEPINEPCALISRQAAIANAISGITREIDGEKWIRVSEVRESIKTLPSSERPIDVQEAYFRGKIDGIKECTELLKKVNEEFANDRS